MTILSPLTTYSAGNYIPLQTGRVDLVVFRQEAGSYIERRWVEGQVTPVTVKAVNIQPMSDNQKLILAEADRTKEWLKLYSPEPLRTIKEGIDGHDSDKFEYEGVMYEVCKARVYRMGVLNHCKALAVSLEKTPGASSA